MSYRHARTDSVSVSGSAWLPPFGPRVQDLLAQPVPNPGPISFGPAEWVQATWPHMQTRKGGKMEGYVLQLRRTLNDLCRTRDVSADSSPGHPLVLHAIEGMVEAYTGLHESVRAMLRFQSGEGGPEGASAAANAGPNGRAAAAATRPGDSHSRGPSQASSPPAAASSPSPTSSSPSPSPSSNELNTTGSSGDLEAENTALVSVRTHCVRTLRALRNLHCLVCGVDALRDVLVDSEFQAARLAFAACTELFHTLSTYSRLPILQELNEHVECYKAQLRKDIFATFREHMGNSLAAGTPASPLKKGQSHGPRIQSLVRLHHCCRLIDLLYSSLERKELVKWWVAVELHGYSEQVARRVFGDVKGTSGDSPCTPSGALIPFEQIDAQFNWIHTELRDVYETEYVQVFPQAWYVDALLTRRFFELVRAQFAETLENLEKRINDENNRRQAVAEAKKAQILMQDLQRIHASGGSGGTGGAGSGRDSLAQAKRRSHNHSLSNGELNGSSPTEGGGSSNSAPRTDLLDAECTDPLPFDFYKPLLRTIEFENAIRGRWLHEKSDPNLTEEDLFTVLGKVANPALQQQGDGSGGDTGEFTSNNPPPYPFQFAGYISSAFHPYLPRMVLLERTRFYNFLESLDEEEQWEVASADLAQSHFSAATKLFVMIQKSMERYAKVMPGGCFLDLFKEYRTSISNYVELLSKHLPTGKGLGEEELQALCATINTGDYILDRCAELGNTVVAMLAGQTPEQLALWEAARAERLESGEAAVEGEEYEREEETASFIGVLREQVDLSAVDEQVSHLTHRATHVLASNIVRRLAPALQSMKDSKVALMAAGGGSGFGSNGAAAVSDENKYVREIQTQLRSQLQDKARMGSFPYLAQVVASDFLSLYHSTLRACVSHFKITEQVAQQMLLDLQALKSFLLRAVPDWRTQAQRLEQRGRKAKETEDARLMDGADGVGGGGGGGGGAGGPPAVAPAFKAYVKLLNVQFQPSENLLKALTSPTPRLIATFKAICPNASNAQVYELLALRGLSGSEQEKLIRAHNASLGQANPAQHIPIVKKDFMGHMQQMVRDVKGMGLH